MSQRIWDLATEYGRDEAFMIDYLGRWIGFNRKAGKNQHDGRTWTYDSLERIAERSGLWSLKQVRRIIKSLTQQKVIQVGHYAKFWSDRTNWYAFVDEVKFLGQQVLAGVSSSIKPHKGVVSDQFTEQLAELYNQLLKAQGLGVTANNRAFTRKCQELVKTYPEISLDQIKQGILFLKDQAARDPKKASLLKFKSLLHPKVMGRAIQLSQGGTPGQTSRTKQVPAKGPPAEGGPPDSFVQKVANLVQQHLGTVAGELLELATFEQQCSQLWCPGVDIRIQCSHLDYALEYAARQGQKDWVVLLNPDTINHLLDQVLEEDQQKENETKGGNLSRPPAAPSKTATETEMGDSQARFAASLGKLLGKMDMNQNFKP